MQFTIWLQKGRSQIFLFVNLGRRKWPKFKTKGILNAIMKINITFWNYEKEI